MVTASRAWVCIRLLTYENEAEYKYMEKLLGVRQGTLPNTVFCMLSPDGKTQLTRPARTPAFFRTPQNMAVQMQRLAARYQPAVQPSFVAPIPVVDRVDLAMNVAASDNRPLVVLYHPEASELVKMLEMNKKLAWQPAIVGQFIYAATTGQEELKPIMGQKGQAGLYVVEPDEYGVSGKVTQFVKAERVYETALTALRQGLAEFQPFQKNHQQHIQNGYVFGIEWETVVPESDPMSVQAKQRYKARFESRP